MVRSRINRLPVLRDGRVVGIISRADVVRALVRPHNEITQVVREALVHDLRIDISQIGIDVRQASFSPGIKWSAARNRCWSNGGWRRSTVWWESKANCDGGLMTAQHPPAICGRPRGWEAR